MKSLMTLLNRLMPVMMPILIILLTFQALISLHVTSTSIADAMRHTRFFYAPSALLLIALTLAGYVFDRRVQHDESRKGNLGRGFFMDVLARLTNEKALIETLSKAPRATLIDAEELAAGLRARVVGQDDVCEEISQQLRRRLAVTARSKPVGIFLLAGPAGTGKTYLASQISRQLGRKLAHFDMMQKSDTFAAPLLFDKPGEYVEPWSLERLTSCLKQFPDSIVLLDGVGKAHPDVLRSVLIAWNNENLTEVSTGEQVTTTRAVFILSFDIAAEALTGTVGKFSNGLDGMRYETTDTLRHMGVPPEILGRLDRVFFFRPLCGLDLARVAALEVESMIQGYGLRVESGGIDTHMLHDIMQQRSRTGTEAPVRDLVRTIEDMISDDLIVARQGGAGLIRLVPSPEGVKAQASSAPETSRVRLSW